jgi:acyl-CoA reductase-like NAD-dependent aldehyde dehydrogenase
MTATPTTLASTNPATGDVVGTVPIHTPAEVDAAVARARTAAAAWGALNFADREHQLVSLRRALADAADELADIIHRENGKPLHEALLEVFMSLGHVQHAMVRAPKVLASEKVGTGLLANFRATISYLPLGVVGVIGPWNYPMFTPMGSIAYALAAGNTVVWKPSELTPLIAVKIAEIAARAISIPNVLQVVTGLGPTGAALAKAAVDKIAFTGSAPTGRRVMVAAAERLTPVLLELGGKDPMIVTEDADLDRAAEAAVFGGLTNAGQACVSVERVYVAAGLHDAFVGKVVEEARALRVGGDAPQIGAMTSPAQVEIVRDHLRDAVAKGATVLCGGEGEIKGNYIPPTVLVGVTHDMKIMTEETFGPVIPIMKVASVDEAVERANDSIYGLASTVFAGKGGKAIADRLKAGMSSVNAALAVPGIPGLPFGGVGDSGFGRIHGDQGLREFSRIKSTAEEQVAIPLSFLTFRLPANVADRVRTMIHQIYGSGVVARAQDAVRRVF